MNEPNTEVERLRVQNEHLKAAREAVCVRLQAALVAQKIPTHSHERLETLVERAIRHLDCMTQERDAVFRDLTLAEMEIQTLLKLAYVGDHYHPNLSWKVRAQELRDEVEHLKLAHLDALEATTNAALALLRRARPWIERAAHKDARSWDSVSVGAPGLELLAEIDAFLGGYNG